MPDIAALIQDKAKLAVPYEDDVINVVYAPSKINAHVEAKAQDMRRGGRIFGAHVALLADWLVEWDLTDGKKPYPLDEEHIAKLPHEVVQHIRDSILADYFPKMIARTAKHSANGS